MWQSNRSDNYLDAIDWPLVVLYARTAGRFMAEVMGGMHVVDFGDYTPGPDGKSSVTVLWRKLYERLEYSVSVWGYYNYPGVLEALKGVDVKYVHAERRIEIWSSPAIERLMKRYHPMSALMEQFERENAAEDIAERRRHFSGVLGNIPTPKPRPAVRTGGYGGPAAPSKV